MIINPYIRNLGWLPNVGYSANVNSQLLSGFNSISLTAMEDMLCRQILVSQSRQLLICNGNASSAINQYCVGVVGGGISYIPPEKSRLIGDIYPKLSTFISNRLSLASESLALDAQESLTFEQMQGLALESMLSSGEVFYVRKPDSYAWTAIEADRVMNPYYLIDAASPEIVNGVFKLINAETGNRIVDGIEIDSDGKEVAVWVLKEAISTPFAMAADQIERIPRYDVETGLPLYIHLFQPKRPAQYRGIPILAPVIETVFMQSNYLQSEQNAAALQASLYGFITSDRPVEDSTSPELPNRLDEKIPVFEKDSDNDEQDDQEGSEGDKKPTDFNIIYNGQDARAELYAPHAKPVSSGRFMHLASGEDIKFLQSTHPTTMFEPFYNATTEIIASALGLPAEVLRMSFNSSYSASRAALLQAYAKFSQVRSFFIQKFIKPVLKVFVYENTEFLEPDERLYLAEAMAVESEFRVPKMPCIDQRQELEAWRLALEMGVVTRDDISMAMYNRRAPEHVDMPSEDKNE